MEIRFKRPWYLKVAHFIGENWHVITITLLIIFAIVAIPSLLAKCYHSHIDEVDRRNASTTYYCEYVDKSHFKTKKLVFKGPEKGVFMDTTHLHLGVVDFNGKVAKYFDDKDSWEWRRLARVEDVHKIIKFYKFRKPKQTAKKQGKETEAKAVHRHHKK